MAQLIGSLGALFLVVVYVAVVVLGIGLPFMAFSATRNLKGIRRQLERLNDTLERGGPPAEVRAMAATFRPAADGDTRTAAARPGALGI